MYNQNSIQEMDSISNYHSVTNRKKPQLQEPQAENQNLSLTPRTVQKYRMANKKYEDLLSNINSDSTLTSRKQEYNNPGLFPSVTGRNISGIAQHDHSRRGGSDGLLEHNSFQRKRQRFDPKKLTPIKVPKFANKEARAPVLVDEQRERNSLPHIMSSTENPPVDLSSSDFPSMTPTLNLLALDGFSPLPITPSSSAMPCWPWTPTPKVAVGAPEFNNWGIEPPLKKRKF